jgi:hypothetical protein
MGFLIEQAVAPSTEQPAMDSFSTAMRDAMRRELRSARGDALEHASGDRSSGLREAVWRVGVRVRRILRKLRLCQAANIASDSGDSTPRPAVHLDGTAAPPVVHHADELGANAPTEVMS